MWQQSWPQQWIAFHVKSDIWKCKITSPILDTNGINGFLTLPCFYPNMLMDLVPCQLTNRQSKRSLGINGLEGGNFLLMNRIYMWGNSHGLNGGFETIIRLWAMGMVDDVVEQQWYIGLQMDRLLANPSSRHMNRLPCPTFTSIDLTLALVRMFSLIIRIVLIHSLLYTTNPNPHKLSSLLPTTRLNSTHLINHRSKLTLNYRVMKSAHFWIVRSDIFNYIGAS